MLLLVGRKHVVIHSITVCRDDAQVPASGSPPTSARDRIEGLASLCAFERQFSETSTHNNRWVTEATMLSRELLRVAQGEFIDGNSLGKFHAGGRSSTTSEAGVAPRRSPALGYDSPTNYAKSRREVG